ncbi:hypothetical protein Glove_134g62 [Diversispora epigaea]|uniref:Uncharacterized protein n=1 Tax=Diversispora epigaea TaxID=1348612 RepID=A0A397J5X4_9GLOM|nr:hypothetical protein Glove_134g62 [Diversispora epigaea]
MDPSKKEKDIVAAHEPTHPVPSSSFIPITPPYTTDPTRILIDSQNFPRSSQPPSPRFPPDSTGRRLDEPKRTKLSYICWSFIACLNLYLLIGSGVLIFYYIISSIQSSYEKIAKYILIAYIIMELVCRMIAIYHIHDFLKSDVGLFESLAVILFKKEGYFLFGKKRLSKNQIIILSDVSENLNFILLILFTIHLWLYLKESNPILNTTETSRIVEITLAGPVLFLSIIRCVECRRIPRFSSSSDM